ncbi:MAG TPA: ABC transporter permease [Ktedonobacteraceae bacterium]|jgi:peptide/nickel transport system permease protein|nr:ABC transporter permease [Ktedonobacteraceae bacterium]
MRVNEELQPVDMDAVSVALQQENLSRQRVLRAAETLWNALTANKRVTVGSIVVGIFLVIAIFGPLVVRQDPNALSDLSKAAPSATHLLGTTTTGQDLFSQLVDGTRNSIFWGFITGLMVTVIAVVIGLVGGYFGGWVDEALSMLTNVFLVLPSLPLAIVLAAYFPRGPVTIALVIALTNWAWGARVLRSQTLTMRSREFVTAARTCGESTWRIIFFEIFPNEISLVAASFVSTTVFVILAWAALEFLGLGDLNTISWGSTLHWAQQADALSSGLWWWFIPPGLCIALLGAALSLVNFGIDEVADPRLRTVKVRKQKK